MFAGTGMRLGRKDLKNFQAPELDAGYGSPDQSTKWLGVAYEFSGCYLHHRRDDHVPVVCCCQGGYLGLVALLI